MAAPASRQARASQRLGRQRHGGWSAACLSAVGRHGDDDGDSASGGAAPAAWDRRRGSWLDLRQFGRDQVQAGAQQPVVARARRRWSRASRRRSLRRSSCRGGHRRRAQPGSARGGPRCRRGVHGGAGGRVHFDTGMVALHDRAGRQAEAEAEAHRRVHVLGRGDAAIDQVEASRDSACCSGWPGSLGGPAAPSPARCRSAS